MNSSSTDFETVKAYLAFFFVDCKYIVEEIKQIIERYSRYETHYGGHDVICNQKEVKRMIKRIIPKHDRNNFIKMTKFIRKIDKYQSTERQKFIKNNSDKKILKMINKKYPIEYTENEIRIINLDNFDILECTKLYDFDIFELSLYIENTKYDMKYN